MLLAKNSALTLLFMRQSQQYECEAQGEFVGGC
jgi:hypothetical protein